MSIIATITVTLAGDPDRPATSPIKRSVKSNTYAQTRSIDGQMVTRTPEQFVEILRGSFSKMLDEALAEVGFNA